MTVWRALFEKFLDSFLDHMSSSDQLIITVFINHCHSYTAMRRDNSKKSVVYCSDQLVVV